MVKKQIPVWRFHEGGTKWISGAPDNVHGWPWDIAVLADGRVSRGGDLQHRFDEESGGLNAQALAQMAALTGLGEGPALIRLDATTRSADFHGFGAAGNWTSAY